jgi:putative acetyltransferase
VKPTRLRPAVADDLAAVKALADAERGALGFVLRPALAEAIDRGEMLVVEQSGAVAGFVDYHQRRDRQVTLYHIVVAAERRGGGVGRALLQALRATALATGATRIVLKCPVGLPANDFYRACGYTLRETEPGRGRALNVWAVDLAHDGGQVTP